ncbi:MAG TPA: amino acid adenylation domain-containing protein, partial [Thermoanaerobaculia bacterium]|nr:amino acid adenylation domain-containing protein [Thermoanaerobaculia bacterium]
LLPPTVLATLSPEDLPGLATLIVGGEACPVELARAWAAGRRLWNAYGPTEASVVATVQLCDPREGGERLPIGRPIARMEAYVLDARGNPVPIGVAGELCLGGPGLARGYLDRPDRTAASFVPHPLAASPGERLYRTGDLARTRPDGEIDLLGRIDHQVKVRGYRIELGEIEAALARHPQALESVVVLREDRPGDRRLVAYVVTPLSSAALSSELRTFLRDSLPEFMVPATSVSLAALPVSANGKVDRKALPQPIDRRERGDEDLAPRTPIEELLAGIWSDLLRVEEVGRNDDFFELGGHSLQGIRLMARVREVLGVDLPIRTLFLTPTLAALAAGLSDEMLRQAAQVGATRMRPLERRDGPLPLSFAQERLWFLEQLEPGSAFYNIPALIRMEGELRFEALVASLEELTRRHEALRTTFADLEGQPYQRIETEARVSVPVIDLAALPPARRESELRQLATHESRRPFDLARGPLMRVVLFRLAAGDQVIVHTTHHIISDGWSAVIFLREIATLYEAFSTGRPALLPALPVQYADYAAWQRSYLEGPVLETQLSYWRDRLTGAPALELPADRPRPAVETFRGASRPVQVPQEAGRALIALSRREGATLFMTLLALFKTLLLRYSGQTDLAVGSPIANRNRSEVESVIGFFSNTVVLRTDLGGDPSFRELLLRVREVALGAYAHEDLPFEKIVEELQPERDMSRNPLFQVMCVLQNQPRESLPAGDLRMSPFSIQLGIAKFDLTLFWYEEQGWLSGLLEYNTDLFDHSTALRFFQHYERLLESVLADPGRPLSTLPLLDDAERHQLVNEWSDTAARAEYRCIHAWVEEQVELTPEAVAVVFGEQRLSYREVNLRANRLAHGLMRRGVGPESLVGICVDRSLEMVVAALAVLKSGGALVALDPAYPRERLATIIEDAGLAILLKQEPLLQHFPRHREIALCLAPGVEPFPFESSENPRTGLTPDQPMYVIYTSGSTGQPKGIVVPHRAFANLAFWQLSRSPSTGGIRTVQFSTFGFCVSFQEIFSAWCSGGTLVVADERTRRDAERLAELLASESIERLHLPFAALKQVADVRESFLHRPMRLREIITAGEQLRVTPAVRDLLERLPGCSLHNQYGASETHVVCELALAGETVGWPAIPSVGRPISNVRIHLLDSRLEPVPIGVRGDLYAGGACLARAYLQDPVLTAQKMVPDPFAMESGARLYWTGDSARHLSDGQIEFLGRADGQVKIRGFRVELGDVETVMASYPRVRDAVAVAQPVEAGGLQLVAYVVGDLQVEELRAYLKQRLSEYMVPSAFVQLPALPLNANGKLDQAALPRPEAGGGPAGPVAPCTHAEELLAGLWAEVLHRERVGATDNFFDLGGHSLLATRLMSRLRGAFGVELPLRTLFERPTVAELAAAVEEARYGGMSAAPPLVRVARAPRSQDPPLSFAQERLWFLDRIDPGTPTYNMPGRVELTGSLDVAALAAALRGLVKRHEVLRTFFQIADGIPRQLILPELEIGMPVADLAALPEAGRRAETERLAADHARHRFDLACGPLLDAVLVRLESGRHQLFVVVHHVICDGWSLHLLVRDIGELYGGCAAGRPSSLGELPVQYADFAVWQRELVAGTRQMELAWWLDLLSGEIAPLDMPTDRMRPAVQTYRGGQSSLALSAGFAARLAAFGRAHGSTLFMTLLAAIKTLLHRHSGQDDILVGTPVAGRRAVETEGLIGCFLNTLVLRTGLGGRPGFRDLVARVREVTLGAYSHQDVPFEAVLAGLPQPRDLSRTPLFQVMVNLLNLPSTELRLPGLVLESLTAAEPLSKFDMTFYIREEDGVRVELVYNADLFDAGRMEDLLAQLAAFLDQALDRPEEPVGALSLVTAAARAVLPDPAAPLPAVWTGAVHERFAEQARQHAERPALLDRDGVWSYGELETAANRLSAWLQGHGVRPGDRVAVYAHRSAPLALAVLGTLKAGAAFTILDPAYPVARLTAALVATAPRALLRLEAAGAFPAALSEWLRDSGCPDLALPRGGSAPVLRLLAGLPDGVPGRCAGPEDLAWVSFTSGSTGMPKGVLGSHRPLSHFIAWHGERFGLTASDRFSLLSGLAHDPLLRDLFTPLCLGAPLAIPQPEELASPGRFAHWMRAQGVTVAHLTPALSEVLTEAGEVTLETLRFAFFGGDVLTRRAVERLRGMAPGCACVNYYGATETPQGMGFHEVSLPDRERIPLGRGIDGVQLLVLNAADRLAGLAGLAGIGELGEICIRTPYLAQGYLHDEELTRERFVANPFTAAPDDRLYRTGDLGRYLPDGSVDLQGRRDAQVKIRGFRIELGEIEA